MTLKKTNQSFASYDYDYSTVITTIGDGNLRVDVPTSLATRSTCWVEFTDASGCVITLAPELGTVVTIEV